MKPKFIIARILKDEDTCKVYVVHYYWAIYVSLSRKSRIHDVSIRIEALLSMKEFKFVDHSKSSNKLLKLSTFVACEPLDSRRWRSFFLLSFVVSMSVLGALVSYPVCAGGFLWKIKRLELVANNTCLSVAEI